MPIKVSMSPQEARARDHQLEWHSWAEARKTTSLWALATAPSTDVDLFEQDAISDGT